MSKLLGVVIILATLIFLNTFFSLATSYMWRISGRYARRLPAQIRADLLFSLRSFPLVASSIIILGIVAPAYFVYEPAHSGERLSWVLLSVSTLAVIGLSLALCRGLLALIVTQRLARRWIAAGEILKIGELVIDAYVIDHEFPVVAVVGVFRPRLFIARSVISNLSNEEFRATLSHEKAHLFAYDNLKWTIIRLCRDSLILSRLGGNIDWAWRTASEEAADYRAGSTENGGALDLASALIKIARLVPANRISDLLPQAAFLIESAEGGGIEDRIRILVERAGSTDVKSGDRFRWLPTTINVAALCLLTTLIFLVSHSGTLFLTHHAIEWIVATLR